MHVIVCIYMCVCVCGTYLILVEEVSEGEEQHAEGHQQWRDARVRHHYHRHLHVLSHHCDC